MNEDLLYAQNASEQADRAEYWARKAQKAANQIDIPALMLITIACSLLLTCLGRPKSNASSDRGTLCPMPKMTERPNS